MIVVIISQNSLKIIVKGEKKMTKQEQIEQMAKIIDDRLVEANLWLGSMNKGKGYWIAEKLVEHYQPKLPIDSVVLSREEHEMLANQYKNLEIKYSNLCDWIIREYNSCFVKAFKWKSCNSYIFNRFKTCSLFVSFICPIHKILNLIV